MGIREREFQASPERAPLTDPPPENRDVSSRKHSSIRETRRGRRRSVVVIELRRGPGVHVHVIPGFEEPRVGGDNDDPDGTSIRFIGREREIEEGQRDAELGASADEETV